MTNGGPVAFDARFGCGKNPVSNVPATTNPPLKDGKIYVIGKDGAMERQEAEDSTYAKSEVKAGIGLAVVLAFLFMAFYFWPNSFEWLLRYFL